jgi:hypoxanthine phosphoribosyltransferase
MMEKEIIGWAEYGAITKFLVQSVLLDAPLLEGYTLLAIGRGGYIPGVAISHALNRELFTIDIKAYTGTQVKKQKEVEIGNLENSIYKKERLLIIDDIYETGTTLSTLEYYLRQDCRIYRAILINKNDKPLHKLHAIGTHKDSAWITLPYEVE